MVTESATSVTVSWFPPEVQFWNGIITSYTVTYDLIKRVDMESMTEPIRSDSLTVPQPGMVLSNNPDPTAVDLPLKRESVAIKMLEEFYVYQFTVVLENAVGQSDASGTITVNMPPSGTYTARVQKLCINGYFHSS